MTEAANFNDDAALRASASNHSRQGKAQRSATKRYEPARTIFAAAIAAAIGSAAVDNADRRNERLPEPVRRAVARIRRVRGWV